MDGVRVTDKASYACYRCGATISAANRGNRLLRAIRRHMRRNHP